MAGRHYTALGYCDEVDIENFLLTDIDSSFSSQVEDWIAVAEKQVNKYLGYTTASGIFAESIVGETVEGRVDSDLNLVVFPRKTPIISISKLEVVKGSASVEIVLADSDTHYTMPTSADRFYIPQNELTTTGSTTLANFAELRITKFFTKISYRAGYTEVPADIRQATVNLVSDVIMRHANKEALESITQGRVSKRWQTRDGQSDFVKDAYDMLKPYRIAHRWLA